MHHASTIEYEQLPGPAAASCMLQQPGLVTWADLQLCSSDATTRRSAASSLCCETLLLMHALATMRCFLADHPCTERTKHASIELPVLYWVYLNCLLQAAVGSVRAEGQSMALEHQQQSSLLRMQLQQQQAVVQETQSQMAALQQTHCEEQQSAEQQHAEVTHYYTCNQLAHAWPCFRWHCACYFGGHCEGHG